MKNRFYILFVLIGLLGTLTVSNADAQRVSAGRGGGGHFGGGGGFHSGGGRVYTAPRMSSPRVVAPVNRGYYYHGGGRAYYGRSWYRPYYRPYYNPFYPRLGIYVSSLPFGYFSLGAAFGPMYYFGGSYYQATGDDRGYKVVEAPNGAAVPDLPDGAQEITVDGNTYYELNGTYYQETMTDNGRRYVVVGKNGKIGDKTVTITDDQNNNSNNNPDNGAGNDNALLSQLPDNCRTVNINGQQLFLSPDGMYYQSVLNSDNTIAGYKVVGKMDADK
ncbi:DUF6515 family protein [Chitinophaga arvensicola]|uniref:Uncharacterized protein n=1 Tax=Chitinophaga arvensicola TaxID=29529 RepID=A0A1I0SDX2_9BACT|nr:DUF6515 family protein [Chitinophaga arvensicola]SEW56255.1 hypothetical protein SAMN04488122_6610 [Chitinophaga arvensicola]